MCLDKITKRFTTNERVVKGFKVVLFDGGALLKAANQKTNLNRDAWMKAKLVILEAEEQEDRNGNYVSYPSGFHIWAKRSAAEKWVTAIWSNWPTVVPVTGRGVRVRGTQEGNIVYVCKELYIDSKDLPKSV